MRHPAARVLLVVVGVLVALNGAVYLVERSVGGPAVEGPASSSYTTEPQGAAAYADLLVADGRRVVRSRTPLAAAVFEPGSTVVMLDPGRPGDGTGTVRAHLEAGGRVVVGGHHARAWAFELVGWRARLGQGPGRARPLVPVAETAGVEEVVVPAGRWWVPGGPAVGVLGSREGFLLSVSKVGSGRLLLLSDAATLHNENLARADNAAFALNLVGRSSTVVFVESVHGFTEGRGLAALPVRWRWALAGLALAALVWMLARARRLGPPEQTTRDLAPPRRAYVESVAATLARTSRPADAIEPVRIAVRERIAGRAGYDPMAGDRPLRETALRAGLAATEVEAVLGEGGSTEDVLATGRALARLVRGD